MAHLVRNDLPNFKCWVSIVISLPEGTKHHFVFFLGGYPLIIKRVWLEKPPENRFFLVMNPTYHTPLVNWNLFICREPYQKYSILDGSINEPDGSIISRLLSAIVAPSSKNWGYISDQHWGVWRHWISNSTIGENDHPTQDGDTGIHIELPSADHHIRFIQWSKAMASLLVP